MEERLPPSDADADPPPRRRWASQDVSSPRPPPDFRKQHVLWDSSAAAAAHDDAPTLPSEEPVSPIDSATPLTGAGSSFSEPTGGGALIIPPLPPPPGHNTYVVQMPKDMIYRVPPPENAVFLERLHQPEHQKTKQRCGCITRRCFLCTLLGVFIFLIIVGATLGALYLYLSPKKPEFNISAVSVKHGKNNKTSYEISLEAKNDNDKLGLSYENGGDVSISYDTVDLAQGSFPSFYQDSKNTSSLKIELAGSIKESALPKEVRRSLNDTKTKVPVWLTFSVDNVPIKKKAWSIYFWSVKTDVSCDFKVSSLTTDIKIVSQNCQTQQ